MRLIAWLAENLRFWDRYGVIKAKFIADTKRELMNGPYWGPRTIEGVWFDPIGSHDDNPFLPPSNSIVRCTDND